jgi:hypothetical protein
MGGRGLWKIRDGMGRTSSFSHVDLDEPEEKGGGGEIQVGRWKATRNVLQEEVLAPGSWCFFLADFSVRPLRSLALLRASAARNSLSGCEAHFVSCREQSTIALDNFSSRDRGCHGQEVLFGARIARGTQVCPLLRSVLQEKQLLLSILRVLPSLETHGGKPLEA